MKEIVISQGGIASDHRGSIRFVNDFDMTAVKRFYIIENKDTETIRGWRAHRIEQRCSLIDGKTYRQINLKPTGFFQDSGGQPRTRSGQAMLRYTPPPKGSVCSVAENPGGQHAPQRNPSENIRGSASAVMACPYAAYGQLVLRNQRPSLGVSLLRNIQQAWPVPAETSGHKIMRQIMHFGNKREH